MADSNSTLALKPPPGVESDLSDPPSRDWIVIFAMVLYVATTTSLVLTRMYTRVIVQGTIWWDDWTVVIAQIGLYGAVSIVLLGLRYGGGRDLWNVTLADAERFEELFRDIEIVARISIFFTKLSILLLFLRCFCPPRTRRTWIFYATWFVICFNLLYCLALVLTVLLQCVGKPKSEGPTCVNSYAVLVTASIINVVTDLVMLIIPLVAIWDLQMARKRKWGLSIVFATGGMAVASSVARLAYQIPNADDPNKTVVLTNVIILALAEQAIGIIVGCMPVLPSLYRHLFDRSQSSTSSSKRSAPGYNHLPIRWDWLRSHRLPSEPNLLAADDRELDSMKAALYSTTTTTTVGEGDRKAAAWPATLQRDGDQYNTAIVSKTVDVTSHAKNNGGRTYHTRDQVNR